MSKQQQQGGGGGGGGDTSMGPVWMIAALFFALYFSWHFWHAQITYAIFKINLVQAQFFNFFLHDEHLTNNIYQMQTVAPASVTWDQLMYLTASVGNFTRYPVAFVLVVLGIWLYRSNITLSFQRIHNMDTLRQQEQKNWPAIMPVVKEDLVSQDLNKGPWAMALTPMEFARKYQLLKKEDALLDQSLPGLEMTAGIRRGDSKRVFTLQLGPYWDGFERCAPQVQAMAAVFMARMNRDRDGAQLILKSLDESFARGKIDFSVARPILKKHQNSELVQEILPKHAYVLTVMASLLQAARNDGVVPSSEFLWLKVVDRRLWYMLNCVGRQTPYVEVAGPFAHWRAETVMGRRSLVPMIEEAIKALEGAIKEVKLSPRQLAELLP